MANDWRLAVCTRWRPLIGLLLVCLTVLCTGVVEYFVYTTVDEYPTWRLERRIHTVKVGMSVAELENLLGPPDSKTDKVDAEGPDQGEVSPDMIVEYRYSVENRFGGFRTNYKGIFVDEKTGRVVSIHFSRNMSLILDSTFWEDWVFLIAVGLMVLVVLIVMLFFRRWCQSVTESENSHEA